MLPFIGGNLPFVAQPEFLVDKNVEICNCCSLVNINSHRHMEEKGFDVIDWITVEDMS